MVFRRLEIHYCYQRGYLPQAWQSTVEVPEYTHLPAEPHEIAKTRTLGRDLWGQVVVEEGGRPKDEAVL